MVGSKVGGVVGMLLLVVGLLAAPAGADDAKTWPVKHRLWGTDGAKSTDVSGIACTTAAGSPRSCLVIDDNSQSAQLVTLEDGKIIAGEQVELISNKFKKKALELDGEGVAFAEGFYYVIGSHGHPRDKKHKLDPVKNKEEIDARISAASQVVRIKAGPNGTASVVDRSPNLRNIIAVQPELQRFAEQRLENNGVTIEGIAIRVSGYSSASVDRHWTTDARRSCRWRSTRCSAAARQMLAFTSCSSATVRVCVTSRRSTTAF
jgi:hypothetical protein